MSHRCTSRLSQGRVSEATAGAAQTREPGQEQEPWGRLLGLTLTAASPHRLPSIWAESASSANEVISSPVMGLSVSVRDTPAAYLSKMHSPLKCYSSSRWRQLLAQQICSLILFFQDCCQNVNSDLRTK